MDNDGRVDSGFCEKLLSPDHINISLARSAYKFCRAEKANLHQPILCGFSA